MNLSNRNPRRNQLVGQTAYRKITEKKPLILPKKPLFRGLAAMISGTGEGGNTITSSGSGRWKETKDSRVISSTGADGTLGSAARKKNGASTFMWTFSGSGRDWVAGLFASPWVL